MADSTDFARYASSVSERVASRRVALSCRYKYLKMIYRAANFSAGLAGWPRDKKYFKMYYIYVITYGDINSLNKILDR